jgi:glycosyltransferase involved in cell wall biosynthesis
MNSKIVVYFVTNVTSANIFGYAQIQALSEQGYKVHLICNSNKLRKELQRTIYSSTYINTLKRGISPINDIKSFIYLLFILIKLKPTIIIYSTPKAAFFGSIASSIIGTKIRIYQIWGIRWQNFSGVKLWVVRSADLLAIYLSTKVLIVSRSVLKFLSANYKFSNLNVLGSGSTTGVDSSIFYPNNLFRVHGHGYKIGYAGRVSNDKGIADLFDLFTRLSTQKSDLYLEIIGDLDLEDKISEKLIMDLKSNPRIEWISSLSQVDLAKRMRHWDLQIFLSKREGLGNVILEAGACGVPTFCWNVTGTKDAIPDFAQDFLILYGDMDLLEKSVSSYLNSPLEQIEKLKLAQWYLNNFEQKKVLSEFVGFINANLKAYYDSK